MLSTNCPATNYHPDCFNLTAQNVKRKPENKVAYTKEVTLEYQGHVFLLGREGELRIDGVVVSPISDEIPANVTVVFNGKDLVS